MMLSQHRESSKVAIYTNLQYDYKILRPAVENLLNNTSLGFLSSLSRGDSVLVKPFLNLPRIYTPEDRRLSHPMLIRTIVEVLRDAGCQVMIGDDGSTKYSGEIPNHREWLFDLAKYTGANLVSFAKEGACFVSGDLLYPRRYPIAKPVLECDAIINCANFQPQQRLIISGAVRNMFNSVIGDKQQLLYRLFPSHKSLAKIIVDVCKVTKPTLSILDLISVVSRGKPIIETESIGLLIASKDPVALDFLASKVVGFDKEKIWTNIYGVKSGLGVASENKIDLINSSWPELPCKPLPRIVPTANIKIGFRGTLARYFSNIILAPKPIIDTNSCNNCGDCEKICFTGAIARNKDGVFEVNNNTCVNCGLCSRTCDSNAIKVWGQNNRNLMQKIWSDAKSGYSCSLGSLELNLSFRKSRQVTQPSNRMVNKMSAIGESENRSKVLSNNMENMENQHHNIQPEVALIVGAGKGLGQSLSRHCASKGMNVAMVVRQAKRLDSVTDKLNKLGVRALAYGCDATKDKSVRELIDNVVNDLGIPDLVVYNVEHFVPGSVLDITTSAFEECWKATCLGAFIVGREVAKRMVTRGSGTIIFTGASASMRGKSGYVNLAVGKGGARLLAQSMARELGPKGVHVAHIVIDGGILSNHSNEHAYENKTSIFPDEIAETYYNVHKQHPSAWSQEIDLRPWSETF